MILDASLALRVSVFAGLHWSETKSHAILPTFKLVSEVGRPVALSGVQRIS